MMIFRTVHLSGVSGEVEVRLIRLKCRLGASHPKIAENNVALTTIAIDVPQCSAGSHSMKPLCSTCDDASRT